MRCSACGVEAMAMSTCRWRSNGERTFALCRDCLDAPLRSSVWIVPGPVPCVGLCRGCSGWFPVSELAELVPAGGKWSAPSGLCPSCAR